MLENVTNESVLKIVTTANARRSDQYFTVFIFGKGHFMENMNTSEIQQQFKFVHANSDLRKILGPRQISDSRQSLDPLRKFIDPRQNFTVLLIKYVLRNRES